MTYINPGVGLELGNSCLFLLCSSCMRLCQSGQPLPPGGLGTEGSGVCLFCYPKQTAGLGHREHSWLFLGEHVTMMRSPLPETLFPFGKRPQQQQLPQSRMSKPCLLSPRPLGSVPVKFLYMLLSSMGDPSFQWRPLSFQRGVLLHWRLFSNGDSLQWRPVFSMRTPSFFKEDLQTILLKRQGRRIV